MVERRRRGLTPFQTSEPIHPVWYAIGVPSQREQAAKTILERQGIYSFYPHLTVTRKQTGPRKRVTVRRPMIPGMLFTRFTHAPNWPIITNLSIFYGPMCIAGRAVQFGRHTIRQLQGLPADRVAIEEERRALARLHPGDEATFTAGPLQGMLVRILQVHGSEITFALPSGVNGTSDSPSLRRVS